MTESTLHDNNDFQAGVGAGPPGFEVLQKTRSNTLTRADITDAVQREADLPKAEASFVVAQILNLMAEAIERGENVKISSFGTFLIREKAPRMGRNPKTGVEAVICKRRVLTFRSSTKLRDRVNGTR